MLPPLVAPSPPLTPAQRQRYARHLLIPAIGDAGQRRLLAARVCVMGAGGLGSPALLYLAAAGVGSLTIVDDDAVDLTNLQRQIIHDDASVGTSKVASAATRVRALNPGVEVIQRPLRLTRTNAVEVFRGHNLVLDGTDNFPTQVRRQRCPRGVGPAVRVGVRAPHPGAGVGVLEATARGRRGRRPARPLPDAA